MTPNISLGRFRSEVGAYKHFKCTFDNPLSPFGISSTFNSISVSLSASPYIALKAGDTHFYLSHIQDVVKGRKADEGQTYTVLCEDYTQSNEPTTVKFKLACS